jgi:hypothetical protein
MLGSLSELWKVRRGRKAAVATILPLVEESRLRCQGIADGTWLDPYMIGFMTMLITLAARHKVSRIDSLFLGLVQQEAWAKITGMSPEVLGEHALNLSVSDNRMFALGCQNAIAFDAVLERSAQCALFDDRRFARTIAGEEGGTPHDPTVDALWADCFESHVLRDVQS